MKFIDDIRMWWFGLWNKAELAYLDLAAEVDDRVTRAERLLSILSASWEARMRELEAKIKELQEKVR